MDITKCYICCIGVVSIGIWTYFSHTNKNKSYMIEGRKTPIQMFRNQRKHLHPAYNLPNDYTHMVR